MRDGYRWQQPVPEVVKKIRNRRQYRQHLAEIRAAKARAKCRKEHDAWGFGGMTATEVSAYCDCRSAGECRSAVGVVAPATGEGGDGGVVPDLGGCAATGAGPAAGSVVDKRALPVVVETRLAEVMSRILAAQRKSALAVIAVGEERNPPLAEVVKDVEAALDDARLELVQFFNQCVTLRLRFVEFLHDMNVGSLRVEKPIFKV